MNTILIILGFIVGIGVMIIAPAGIGQGAVLMLVGVTFAALICFNAYLQESEKQFVLQLFGVALLIRVAIATFIYTFELQKFFGLDAFGYDVVGWLLVESWQGDQSALAFLESMNESGWGMNYFVAAIYLLVGRNMLAVQFVNSVLGAATALLVFLCAKQMFVNLRVARLAALLVALFPSIILWSAQGLKDGPIVFLLVLVMLATLKLGERLSAKYFVILACGLMGLLSLRFYIFYMALAAAGGAFVIGTRGAGRGSFARQVAITIGLGLVLVYVGVLKTATSQYEAYGNLERVQRTRADLARTDSGFGRDLDVSTTTGALQAIPIGIIYLLFAPFPWELTNLRQSLTLPEMLVWWACFPLLITGMWFTLRYRMRQALPILIFTTMLTLAYSLFQGNVGTAYRQRSQLLVFYFIFVSVGLVLLKERQEDKLRRGLIEQKAQRHSPQEEPRVTAAGAEA